MGDSIWDNIEPISEHFSIPAIDISTTSGVHIPTEFPSEYDVGNCFQAENFDAGFSMHKCEFPVFDDNIDSTNFDGSEKIPTYSSALRNVQSGLNKAGKKSRKKKSCGASFVKQKRSNSKKAPRITGATVLSRKRGTSAVVSMNNPAHTSAFSPQPRKKKPSEITYTPRKPTNLLSTHLSTGDLDGTPNNSWPIPQTYVDIIEKANNGKIPIYEEHPPWLYTKPKQAMYLLKCRYLVPPRGSKCCESFGFPRLEGRRKEYLWKKMSFTTDVPKPQPLVRYVTAKCHRKNDTEKKCLYRLHAVMKLKRCSNDRWKTEGDYVVVDIRPDIGGKNRPSTPRATRSNKKTPENAKNSSKTQLKSLSELPRVAKIRESMRPTESPVRTQLAETMKEMMSIKNSSSPKTISEHYDTGKSITRPQEVKGLVVRTQISAVHTVQVKTCEFDQAGLIDNRARINPSPIAAPQAFKPYAHNLDEEFTLACEEPSAISFRSEKVSSDDKEQVNESRPLTPLCSIEKRKVYSAGKGPFHFSFRPHGNH